MHIFEEKNLSLNKNELVEIGETLDFSLSTNDCELIERTTKLQSSSKEWLSFRYGRVTASRLKDVCSVKTRLKYKFD